MMMLQLSSASVGNPTTDWTLAWSDEFSGTSVDMSRWLFEDLPAGRYNNELQRYAGNAEAVGTAAVENGELVITAKRSGSEIISARMNSRYNFTYGMVEMRGKVPYDQAIWPAFWMLGRGNNGIWPGCGEMDILEVFGQRLLKNVSSTVHNQAHHFPASNPLEPGEVPLPDIEPVAAEGAWHIWRLIWSPQRVSMTLDAADPHDASSGLIFCYDIGATDRSDAQWPYHWPFYLLINVAVGGAGVLNVHPSEEWQQSQLRIDYVRVYDLPAGYRDPPTTACDTGVNLYLLVGLYSCAGAGGLLALVVGGWLWWRCRARRKAGELLEQVVLERGAEPGGAALGTTQSAAAAAAPSAEAEAAGRA